MFCSQCGKAINTGDNFCAKCGAPISFAHEESTAQPSVIKSTPPPVAVASSFRDPTELTQWLKYFLYASVAISVIVIFSCIVQYSLLNDLAHGAYSSQALAIAAGVSNYKLQHVLGLLQLGIVITQQILFYKWLYRSNFNVRQLGAQGMKFSPAWSIGYFFVPIVGLWKPYQAMKEIWQASKNPSAWKEVKRGSVLPWWWLFYIAELFFSQAVFRSIFSNETNPIDLNFYFIVTNLVGIPCTILTFILVTQIYGMQMNNSQQISNSFNSQSKENFGGWGTGMMILIGIIEFAAFLILGQTVHAYHDYQKRALAMLSSQQSLPSYQYQDPDAVGSVQVQSTTPGNAELSKSVVARTNRLITPSLDYVNKVITLAGSQAAAQQAVQMNPDGSYPANPDGSPPPGFKPLPYAPAMQVQSRVTQP